MSDSTVNAELAGRPVDGDLLNHNSFIAFIGVTDINRAMHFYSDALGLTVKECNEEYCVLDANGTTLRLTKVMDKPDIGYTVAGWAVDDIETACGVLSRNGVAFQRYEGITQDAQGIWNTAGGVRVAWFLDPDNNILSITQFAPA